ncbi:MAG: HAD-IIB family hydrolase [Actinomycetota bacterium]|nr:HAD-IIB family hydrolase [Actinomycetota bacterium]
MRQDFEYVERVASRNSLRNNIEWIRQNLMPVKVVYSDLDGTMLGPVGCFFRDADFGLTIKPALALLNALSRNVDIMLVSGRHRSQLRETARILGCRNYVAELGTEIIYDLGANVLVNIGELEVPSGSVYDYIISTGVVDFLLDRYQRKLEMHTPWSEERDCTPLMRGYVDVKEAKKLLEENGFSQFDIIDNGVIARKSPSLDTRETRAYHIVPKGVSKEQAVLRDREYRTIKKEETVAVGDAEADLPFADVVGAFFLVRNGLESNPHLARVVDETENIFVTEEKMGLGWAEVLDVLLSIQQ